MFSLLIAALLALSGCSSKDKETPAPSTLPATRVAADWVLNYKTQSVALPGAPAVSTTTPYATGSMVHYEPGGAWHTSGSGIPAQSGTYTVSGSRLSILLNGKLHNLTITELTPTRMVTHEVVDGETSRIEIDIASTR